MKITKEELLKIAEQSSLYLSDKEAELFSDQIRAILDYAEQLQEVTLSKEVESVHNSNILRKDTVVPNNPEEIVNLAPEKEDNQFVVPKILD